MARLLENGVDRRLLENGDVLLLESDGAALASGAPTDQTDTAAGTATAVAPTATASGTPSDQRDTASGTATSTDPAATATGTPSDQRDTASGTATAVAPTATASGTPSDQRDTASGTATAVAPTATASGTPSDQRDTASGTATSTDPAATATGTPSDQRDTASGTATATTVTATSSGAPTDQRDTASGTALGNIYIPPATATGAATDRRDLAIGRQSPPPVTRGNLAFEFAIRASDLQEGPPVAVAAKQEQRDIELEDYLSDVHHANEAVIADTTQGNLPWAPTFTNLTAGTGATVTGGYAFSNGMLSCWGSVILGTGFTIGSVLVDVPAGFELDSASFREPLGSIQMHDTTASTAYTGFVRFSTSTDVQTFRHRVSGDAVVAGVISSTAPFIWAVGDGFGFEFHAPAHRI